ncbi:hypothetical protein IO99_06675 [Clostridium sulfidigenes]|uniref:Uncharacterized protein n=1 Tax=Clostridium sulfidigenes TaxID=318464 RepID=A0A084JE71_9CLOT|nr:hypothetical protein [Clostridium sulfidigenes]KEZ87255.1 hypothetical protein IO99_06675 [Clostridium sulfidigenes]
MSVKQVSIFILLLLIISLLYSTIGPGITILILAIMFFTLAILFTFKTEYYDKYLVLVNPKLYDAYEEKGSDFIRKKRITTIISYYILSGLTGFNGFMQIRLMNEMGTKLLFSFNEFLPFALVVLVVVFITNYICIYIAKKSKTAGEDLMWNIIVGIVLAIALMIFITFYILS